MVKPGCENFDGVSGNEYERVAHFSNPDVDYPGTQPHQLVPRVEQGACVMVGSLIQTAGGPGPTPRPLWRIFPKSWISRNPSALVTSWKRTLLEGN